MQSTNIYITHYRPLKERKEYLDSNLNFKDFTKIYIKSDDQEFVKSNPDIDYISEWKKRVNNIMPVLLFNSGLSNYISNTEKISSIPEWARYRKLKKSEISLIHKHQTALLLINASKKPGIIVEDDVVVLGDSEERLINLMQIIKENDIDYIDIGEGCNLPLQKGEEVNPQSKIVKLNYPRSRTTAGYIVSAQMALKLAENIFPSILPLDWSYQYCFSMLNCKVAWSCPGIFKHGSQINYKSSIQ